MLEGRAFPPVGEELVLKRAALEVRARVAWCTDARCGVAFDSKISIESWVAGLTAGAASSRDQLRVDSIQAEVRAGLPAASPKPPPTTPVKAIDDGLDQRLADELGYVSRLLDTIGDALTDEPALIQRHAKALQNFDLACQILGHLATVLTADDRQSAVNAIGMDGLRARLLRKAIFKE